MLQLTLQTTNFFTKPLKKIGWKRTQNTVHTKKNKDENRQLDTPKRMIERRDREKDKGRRRDIVREEEIRERERGERDIYRESERETHRERERVKGRR